MRVASWRFVARIKLPESDLCVSSLESRVIFNFIARCASASSNRLNSILPDTTTSSSAEKTEPKACPREADPRAFAMGYLRAACVGLGGFTPRPRPTVHLRLRENHPVQAGQPFTLVASASANTRRVRYYQEWRFIGESTDAKNRFPVVWTPYVPAPRPRFHDDLAPNALFYSVYGHSACAPPACSTLRG